MKTLEKIESDLGVAIERQHSVIDFIDNPKERRKEFLKLQKETVFLKNAKNALLSGFQEPYLRGQLKDLIEEKSNVYKEKEFVKNCPIENKKTLEYSLAIKRIEAYKKMSAKKSQQIKFMKYLLE